MHGCDDYVNTASRMPEILKWNENKAKVVRDIFREAMENAARSKEKGHRK